MKKSDPAKRILEAAETLFARKGFDAVSIREIAQLAEVQSSAIYYYYENKNEVYKSNLEKSLDELTDILESAVLEGKDPIDRFERYVNSYTDFLHRRTNIAYLVLQTVFLEDPDLKSLVNKYLSGHYLIVEDILREGVEAGVFKPIDTHLLSIFIRGMIVWYFMPSPITDLLPGMEDHKSNYDGKIADEVQNIVMHGIVKQ